MSRRAVSRSPLRGRPPPLSTALQGSVALRRRRLKAGRTKRAAKSSSRALANREAVCTAATHRGSAPRRPRLSTDSIAVKSDVLRAL